MTQSRVTATTSLPELAALAGATARTILHTLNVTGRQRHSVRFPLPSARRASSALARY